MRLHIATLIYSFLYTEMLLSWCWTRWNMPWLFKGRGKHWKVGIVIHNYSGYWVEILLTKGGNVTMCKRKETVTENLTWAFPCINWNSWWFRIPTWQWTEQYPTLHLMYGNEEYCVATLFHWAGCLQIRHLQRCKWCIKKLWSWILQVWQTHSVEEGRTRNPNCKTQYSCELHVRSEKCDRNIFVLQRDSGFISLWGMFRKPFTTGLKLHFYNSNRMKSCITFFSNAPMHKSFVNHSLLGSLNLLRKT